MGEIAHSKNRIGEKHKLAVHLKSVSQLAENFAKKFEGEKEAKLAALIHDLGKYSELFQKRLQGKEKGVDHWSSGAWIALEKFKKEGIASALIAQGHHIGLQDADKDQLSSLDPRFPCQEGKKRPSRPEDLLKKMELDGIRLPKNISSVYFSNSSTTADMLDLRMLFSTVVDADFLDTEAHFQAVSKGKKQFRPSGPPLNPGKAFKVLYNYLDKLKEASKASSVIKNVRAELLEDCIVAAENPPGLFTLTAPTGSGKTLSMLTFALKHAKKNKLNRIIFVIPYLNIIEQTAQEYKKALGEFYKTDANRGYILEDHSMVPFPKGEPGEENSASYLDNLLSENWDAPIIITTTVQLLESLFSNRPSKCRKLHRLSKSVILFDEVQNLPQNLAIPTLSTLSHLSSKYGSSIVFSTATQPAFEHLNSAVKKQSSFGWQPKEIVSDPKRLFSLAKRTKIIWPKDRERKSWEEISNKIKKEKQILCIVNLKRHAGELIEKLKNTEDLYHLSTNLCPAHRKKILSEIHKALNQGRPCRLVSTQCVEAGVDLDFPFVLRAWGPLDSITQAAGRCNRKGNLEMGKVEIFFPEEDHYPDLSYQQASEVGKLLLEKFGEEGIDIGDLELFKKFYRELYKLLDVENQNPLLNEAIKRQSFPDVDKLYKIIPQDTINILVPYDGDIYEKLSEEVRKETLNFDWIQRARPYSIGIYRPKTDDKIWEALEPVPVGFHGQVSSSWFIYLDKDDYDERVGLSPKKMMNLLIG